VLIERAIGHIVKVILKADDSDGRSATRSMSWSPIHAICS